MAEARATFEYILHRYEGGRLTPALGTPEQLSYAYRMHYAEGSAMPPLLLKAVFSRLPQSAPAVLKPVVGAIARKAQDHFVDPQLRPQIAYWEAELARAGSFVGDAFTAADIMTSFPMEAATSRAGASSRPAVAEFLGRIDGRPAF